MTMTLDEIKSKINDLWLVSGVGFVEYLDADDLATADYDHKIKVVCQKGVFWINANGVYSFKSGETYFALFGDPPDIIVTDGNMGIRLDAWDFTKAFSKE